MKREELGGTGRNWEELGGVDGGGVGDRGGGGGRGGTSPLLD